MKLLSEQTKVNEREKDMLTAVTKWARQARGLSIYLSYSFNAFSAVTITHAHFKVKTPTRHNLNHKEK